MAVIKNKNGSESGAILNAAIKDGLAQKKYLRKLCSCSLASMNNS
jgi:hypothetical protein